MKVLLSIKPKYVDKIKNGSKIYEFRKIIWTQKINEILIYETNPIKLIIGKMLISKIIEDTPCNLWKKTKDLAGIEKDEFFNYFHGKHKGYAIHIKEFIKLEDPINPYKQIPNFTAPQSFRYLKNNCPLSYNC